MATASRKAAGVGFLFIGNPHDMRNKNSRLHHKGRMAVWEYSQYIAYLSYKVGTARRPELHLLSPRGTSRKSKGSGWKQRVKERDWRCRTPQFPSCDTGMCRAASTGTRWL
jgi:hypothetical protein